MATAGAAGGSALCLVTDAFGGYGGIAQYNRDLITALATVPSVASVHVLPRVTPGNPEALPAGVYQEPALHGRLRYATTALLATRRYRPRIIFNGHLYHGPLSARLARLSKARLVSQLHGTEIWGDLRSDHRKALEQSHLVLVVSHDTRDKVLAKTGLDPARVAVLHNTVGREFTPGNRQQARAQFGLGDECVVLTVARLDARKGYKGHDRIIPAVARLRREGLNVRYLVSGIGDDQPRLALLAQQCGVAEHVNFLGKVPRQDLPALYRAADLFALPSRGEGFGIAFLEAMACGTRAIGLKVGGAPDALGEGALGLCVSDHEFDAAFDRVVRETPVDATQMAAAVQDRFGVARFQARAVELFMTLDQE